MAKILTPTILNQINNKDIKIKFIFKINNIDYSDYLINWQISYDTSFGSAAATFTLNNNNGNFGEGGIYEISVGDVIAFDEQFEGDPTEFSKFYGIVNQRSIEKKAESRVISLVCLDYIASLQFLDIDLRVEGTKVEVTNEILTPNYLPIPNSNLAQVFDFANDSLATSPAPIIVIEDKNNLNEDPQYDGFEIIYNSGQLKLGVPLNARENYSIKAKSYSYYVKGIYCEDILEDIITEEDGYGNYLFGESSVQDLIDNHLTTTYYDQEATNIDNMTPNYSSSTITVETTLAQDYDPNASGGGGNYLYLTSTEGFPNNGTGAINGNTFSWTAKESGNVLTGISGLKAHNAGDYAEYESSYGVGQVWYLKYSNLITNLTSSDFTVQGANINYVDKRFGRIILDTTISIASVVRCNTNYSFKTLQATGVELNDIAFRPRELQNRYEAIEKLRKYLAPNYIIRTKGDNKIWANYQYQKYTEDYTINLITGINYLEDEDLYTRVIMYGKNNNPTNLMFNENVDFVTTGINYIASADQIDLNYIGSEEGWYVYACAITNAGYILISSGHALPKVWVNDVPIDNTPHDYDRVDIDRVTTTLRTYYDAIKGKYWWGGVYIAGYKRTDIYNYQVHLRHVNIHPDNEVIFYDAYGNILLTISPHDPYMDWANGIYNAGDYRSPNSLFELISTASYTVFYSTNDLQIDYDTVTFRLRSSLFTEPESSSVVASFDYFTALQPMDSLGYMIDGRFDTQVQTEFFATPPTGYNYAVIDLGEIQTIQAMDLIAGFFRPDERGKFDVDMKISIQYSTDNINYYEISDKTHAFSLTGGQSTSFEEDDLGTEFEARYLKIILENVKRIEYSTGRYPVAFTEFAAYGNIVLKSEAKLIPTTELTQVVSSGDITVYVSDTTNFTEADSGGQTAYIGEQAFTYTGKTATEFTGCTIDSGVSGAIGDRVSLTLENDTSMYDDSHLLSKLGDRLYKQNRISDDVLFFQAQLDRVTKAYLAEFYKDHTKNRIDILYAPYLEVGQTVKLVDIYNNTDANYFVESVADSNGTYSLVLARYPEDA